MKPPISIIVFTVLSGAGLGLAMVAALLRISGAADFAADEFLSTWTAAAGLTAAGLCASVLHLANPKNAWRAVMRFRSSWLSREAVFAVLFFLFMAGWLLAEHMGGSMSRIVCAWLVLLAAALTVHSTGMIYQSIKPMFAWHHPLTSLNFFIMALFSGAAIQTVFITGADTDANLWQTAHWWLTVGAGALLLTKGLYFYRLGAPTGLHLGRAMGYTRAQAKLLESGNTAPTFLKREFIFSVSAAALRTLRATVLALIFFIPFLPWLWQWHGQPLVTTALTLVTLAGERWLFFAEAKHTVRLYHGQ